MRRYIRLPGSVDEVFLMIDYTLDDCSSSYAACEVWAHADRLGSTVKTSDSVGNEIDSYTYSPYGESGPEGDSGFPFRFTGQKLDPATGLYYYKARWYDPETGRFLQTDPIGYGDGMNMYAYVGGDPVNGSDPTGTVGSNKPTGTERVEGGPGFSLGAYTTSICFSPSCGYGPNFRIIGGRGGFVSGGSGGAGGGFSSGGVDASAQTRLVPGTSGSARIVADDYIVVTSGRRPSTRTYWPLTGSFSINYAGGGGVIGRQEYAGPVPQEETALSELPFQPTSRQNPITINLGSDNGYSAISITATSTGNSPSYGKVVPGVGKKVPKSSGNGVDVILTGQGSLNFAKTFGLDPGSPFDILLDVHPAKNGTLTIQGTTFVEVWVVVYGLNYYPAGCCVNN